MNIQYAMGKLQEGYKMKRGWWSKEYHIKLSDTGLTPVRVLENGGQVKYSFTPEDILATDWAIYSSTKKYTITKWIKALIQSADIFTKEQAELRLEYLQSIYPFSETRFEIGEIQEK